MNIDIDNEFDESWQLLEFSPICYLTLVEVSNEPDISTPVIKVWERTQAQGI